MKTEDLDIFGQFLSPAMTATSSDIIRSVAKVFGLFNPKLNEEHSPANASRDSLLFWC